MTSTDKSYRDKESQHLLSPKLTKYCIVPKSIFFFAKTSSKLAFDLYTRRTYIVAPIRKWLISKFGSCK